MDHTVMYGLVAIPVIGVLAQVIAYRFNLPAILLLLLSGFIFGPVLSLIDPDIVFGDVFYPLVSLSVALILFEGGLTLKISDLTHTGKVVRNLISIGYLITCLGCAFFAHVLLGVDVKLSLLLGAVLSVSGPTVITPLVNQIQLKRSVSNVLRWEGITIDPLGATVGVIFVGVLLSEKASQAFGMALIIVLKTIVSGLVLGGVGAIVIMTVFKNRWVRSYFHEALTFIIVLSSYLTADIIQSESGLLAVTVMGIILANQKIVVIKHIVTFKEIVSVLLLSSLFVMLAARIEIGALMSMMTLNSFLFVMALIFIVRPISVFFSTLGSSLPFVERLFLACIYPRGIVAASIASIFALKLEAAGMPMAEKIVPITFFTIVVTVIFYAIIGKPLMSVLNLHQRQKGLILAGATKWSREFAVILGELGIQFVLVDTNLENVLLAKEAQLYCVNGSVLSKTVMESLEEAGFGGLLAMTDSDETNLLSTIEYAEIFGGKNVMRLSPKNKKRDINERPGVGRILFGKGISLASLELSLTAGANFYIKDIDEYFDLKEFERKYPSAIFIAVLSPKKILSLFDDHSKIKMESGSRLVLFGNNIVG